MIKKVNYFKLSIYFSIPFLILVLYKFDYLVIPKIVNFSSLLISVLILILSFINACENWRITLKQDGVLNLTVKEGIVSNGLSVFTKYIPGKLFTVLSRAFYIQKKYKLPLNVLTYVSLKAQLLSLWVGLLLGSYIFLFIKLNIWVNIIVALFLIVFYLFLFSSKTKKLLSYLSELVLKKKVDYPILTFKEAIKIIPSYGLTWFLRSVGFYFLCLSVLEYSVSYSVGFGFALASVIAMLAIIAPGGIGIREGLLVTILIIFGVEKQDAVSISVISRLWFLVGEVFIFILASILSITDKDKKTERK